MSEILTAAQARVMMADRTKLLHHTECVIIEAVRMGMRQVDVNVDAYDASEIMATQRVLGDRGFGNDWCTDEATKKQFLSIRWL